MRGSVRELLVPYFTSLVWRDRGANPRSTDPEADALTTRLPGPENENVIHVAMQVNVQIVTLQ